MKRIFVSMVAMLFIAVMLMACASDKEPAQLAVQAAEQATNAARAEATKFVPDQMTALDAALASVKDKMEKKEYKVALAEAQAIPGMVQQVLAAVQAKKDELSKKWTDLAQGIPPMVEAIQSKVDALSQLKPKKLPKDMTVEKVAEAKTALEAVKADLAKAQEIFKAGNVTEAIAAATAVKEKAVKAMEALGIAPPPEAPAVSATPAPAAPATPAAPVAPAASPEAKK
jgi:peptidoglycan hydrolase CwlO-like protein